MFSESSQSIFLLTTQHPFQSKHHSPLHICVLACSTPKVPAMTTVIVVINVSTYSLVFSCAATPMFMMKSLNGTEGKVFAACASSRALEQRKHQVLKRYECLWDIIIKFLLTYVGSDLPGYYGDFSGQRCNPMVRCVKANDQNNGSVKTDTKAVCGTYEACFMAETEPSLPSHGRGDPEFLEYEQLLSRLDLHLLHLFPDESNSIKVVQDALLTFPDEEAFVCIEKELGLSLDLLIIHIAISTMQPVLVRVYQELNYVQVPAAGGEMLGDLRNCIADREDILVRHILGLYKQQNPHPGNLLATPDGKLAFLDFGMMSETPEEARFAIIGHVVHMVNRDYEAMARDYYALDFLAPDVDVTPIVPALRNFFDDALSYTVSELNFKTLVDGLGNVLYQYPFNVPAYYALILRSLTVLEGLALYAASRFQDGVGLKTYLFKEKDRDFSAKDALQPVLKLLLGTDGEVLRNLVIKEAVRVTEAFVLGTVVDTYSLMPDLVKGTATTGGTKSGMVLGGITQRLAARLLQQVLRVPPTSSASLHHLNFIL
uniref:ABC1 atypical kinase-like domain-containing protein n=1 Tax=Cannabis sativa TaxID=3483 RepID=A0A803PX50_CANSA